MYSNQDDTTIRGDSSTSSNMLDPNGDSDSFARIFAPILHFHPEEGVHCCFPSNAERVYNEFGLDWSRFDEDLSPVELDPAAPCYYEFWREPDMVQMKFWFWYNYNRFDAPLGFGCHIGDWEHVEVRWYSPESANPGRIWLLSNHLEARLSSEPSTLTLPGWVPETPSLDGLQIHVWVALGSHANYPSPGSKPKCYLRIWCDKVKDGGPVWNTKNSLRLLDDTNFASFVGRWGTNRSPRGPRNPYNSRTRNAPLTTPVHLRHRG
ncbi:MAG: hypothetical protein ACXADS_06710 [Candidatus Thorarchaeota archaeon]|jgi:hypothetical protein